MGSSIQKIKSINNPPLKWEACFKSRVEKSKRGTECLKVDGIPPTTKVAGISCLRNRENMERGKILVVEDEHIVAMGIKKMLKVLGYTVTGIASSGEDAISKAESTFPDLVLMDVMLKGDIDGIKAAEAIRNIIDIPIVYLTAYSDSKILERAKKTSPYGYIVKPFDEKDLHSSIEMALYKHSNEKGKESGDKVKNK